VLHELQRDLKELEGSVRAARKLVASKRHRGNKESRSDGNKAAEERHGAKAASGRTAREGPLRQNPVKGSPSAFSKADPKDDGNDASQEGILVLPRPAPRTVVINCANVGTVYSESRRQLYATHLTDPGSSSKKGFDWDGVRRVFQYYGSHGLQPQGVCKNRTAVVSPVPVDLKAKVIVCPVVDDQRDADDLFTIRLAMRYGCQLVDNDNYRDWKREEGKWGTTDDIRDWLHGDGVRLKVSYVFDRMGRFIPSVPPQADRDD